MRDLIATAGADRAAMTITDVLVAMALIGAAVAIITETAKGFCRRVLGISLRKSPRLTWSLNAVAVFGGFVGGLVAVGGATGALAGVIAGGTAPWWYHAIIQVAEEGLGKLVGKRGAAAVSGDLPDPNATQDMTDVAKTLDASGGGEAGDERDPEDIR